MSVKITQRQVGNVTVLDVIGRITLGEGALTFRDTIKDCVSHGKVNLLINLGDVSYVDSSGIGELVTGLTNVVNQRGVIKLVALPKRVWDLLLSTKLYTVYEVFGTEEWALRSFDPASALRYCRCPCCGCKSEPPIEGSGIWGPQRCPTCDAEFKLGPLLEGGTEALIERVRFESYSNEYLEIVSGLPFRVRICGRLNLFSSFTLYRGLRAVPVPRRAVLELVNAVELDEEASEAVENALKYPRREDDRIVVSLEGLSPEQVALFPSKPPYYGRQQDAVAALGDISDTPSWRVHL